MGTRRTFTNEFKVEAVKLVTDQGRSIADVAGSLGVGENLLRRWKQQLAAEGGEAFRGNGNRTRPSSTPCGSGCGPSAGATSM